MDKIRATCEHCGKRYRVDPAKIPPQGKKARCKQCGEIFHIPPPSQSAPAPPASDTIPLAGGPASEPQASASSDEGTWSTRTEEGEEGGLELRDIRNQIRFGMLRTDDEVLPPGASRWVPAGRVASLQRYFQLKEGSAATPQAGAVPAAAAGAAQPTRAHGAATLIRCTNHPSIDADFACGRCAAYWCPSCVRVREVQNTRFHVCPKCGEAVDDVDKPRNITPFWMDLGRILVFPFHPKGWLNFVIFVVWSIMAEVAGVFSGLSSLILWLPLLGYLLHLIRESARGADHPVDFPDFGDFFSGMVVPGIQYFLVTLVAFLPAVGWVILTWGKPPQIMGIGLLAGVVLGFMYYPMVLGILAVWNGLTPAINPVLVARLIGQIKTEYAIFLLVWYGAWIPAFVVIGISGAFPFGFVVGSAVMSYVYFVTFHTLGRMLYQCEDKLGWE